MEIIEQMEKIQSKNDFIEFMINLQKDRITNPEDWENDNLDSFLSGLEGYCLGTPQKNAPTWRFFAEILLAARVYE